ncbi:MAG: thiamine pyrophosphate-binding protein [Streptosporangiaceae bacterium]|jgi:thiamine pyrophosphate-dependent acetolactate synthase large subunit-like protein
MLVSEAVGAALAELGADTVFGVVGSGNFHVTNALIARGARYIAARHECGAASMADGWARTAGRPGILSVHQGPGLTNALTGITEAAKSRTPLLVLAADVAASATRSSFRIDVAAIAAAIGAVPARLHSADSAVDDTVRAYRTAADERRTVLLALPLDVQAGQCAAAAVRPAAAVRGAPGPAGQPGAPGPAGQRGAAAPDGQGGAGPGGQRGAAAPDGKSGAGPAAETVIALADALVRARRPVFIAGRGARIAGARAGLEALADACGALLATSAAAKGLFRGSAWDLDVSGGFASPLAAELIQGADLVVGWGCSLNMWTLRHGTLIGPGAIVAQVDSDAAQLGAHRPVDVAVTGDVAATARAVAGLLTGERLQQAFLDRGGSVGSGPPQPTTIKKPGALLPGSAGEPGAGGAGGRPEGGRLGGYRSAELRDRLAREVRWRDVPFTDESDATAIDPRALSIALDDMLPEQRTVAVDSGNFMGYPSMYLSVPDQDGFCFTQAYQSIGLGLGSAIGAAIARPDRLTVAALGDGGALMGISELETVVRLGLPMLIVVYDDEAYGAEVHHFGPDGYPLGTVRFPAADIGAIARGFGCEGLTVRSLADLDPVRSWLSGPRDRPLVIDAKITSAHGSWWLEEAFRGH